MSDFSESEDSDHSVESSDQGSSRRSAPSDHWSHSSASQPDVDSSKDSSYLSSQHEYMTYDGEEPLEGYFDDRFVTKSKLRIFAAGKMVTGKRGRASFERPVQPDLTNEYKIRLLGKTFSGVNILVLKDEHHEVIRWSVNDL